MQSDHEVATLVEQTFAWDTIASRSAPPYDTGSVAVVDGCTFAFASSAVRNIVDMLCERQPTLDTI